jgi:hypothetical protein
VIDVVNEELQMDASEYVDSVSLYNARLIIKTNSSLVSEEIQNIS